MASKETLFDYLSKQGVSRRAFMKYCAATATALAIPAREFSFMAQALAQTPRPSVIWLSFQECTGCTESLTRSFNPTLESLILDHLSLDYHHTLQAASGSAAEAARETAMQENFGSYVLVVDGSVPTAINGAYSAIAGQSNLAMLQESVKGAGLVIAVGTCASFGGIPHANPNPTSAVGVADLMNQGTIETKPLINISGCPPVPDVIGGVIAYFLVYNALPELDDLKRPKVYYGKTVHDCCSRLSHYAAGRFAQSFDDEGARQGHCLYLLGCKGPETFNACTSVKWNGGTSYPMHSGHGCLGCSQPNFWDNHTSFYSVMTGAPAQGDGSSCSVPAVPQLPGTA